MNELMSCNNEEKLDCTTKQGSSYRVWQGKYNFSHVIQQIIELRN